MDETLEEVDNDLNGIVALNRINPKGLCTVATCVIDYHGHRVHAQGACAPTAVLCDVRSSGSYLLCWTLQRSSPVFSVASSHTPSSTARMTMARPSSTPTSSATKTCVASCCANRSGEPLTLVCEQIKRAAKELHIAERTVLDGEGNEHVLHTDTAFKVSLREASCGKSVLRRTHLRASLALMIDTTCST